MIKEQINSNNAVKLAIMSEQMKNVQTDIYEIKKSLEDLIKKIDDTYVTKDQFRPYQMVLGLIGTAVVLYIVGLFTGMLHID